MFWYYQLLCLDTDIIGDSSSIGREYVIYILSDLPPPSQTLIRDDNLSFFWITTICQQPLVRPELIQYALFMD